MRWLLFLWSITACFANKADVMVFSYNRPLQLYAFLESFYQNTIGFDSVTIFYRSDNDDFETGYMAVQRDFPQARFISQSRVAPLKEFRPLVIRFLQDRNFAPSSYVIFAVDDIVVKDEVNFEEDIGYLEQFKAYGFYYRLGKGIDYCYMNDHRHVIPGLKKVANDVFMWNYEQGRGDWNYPNTVDFTLYKKEEILPAIKSIRFNFPNNLEGNWANIKPANKVCLCHEHSKMVNIPVNIVSPFNNRHNQSYSAEELLHIFLFEQKKMDIAPLQKIENRSAHIDYTLTFVPR